MGQVGDSIWGHVIRGGAGWGFNMGACDQRWGRLGIQYGGM